MSQLHLLYSPSDFDTTQEAFKKILSPSLRLFSASVLVFFLTQQLDIRLFQWLKRATPFLPFFVRNALSTSVTQLSDTVLFSFLGLWGLVASLWDIILFSYMFKLIILFFLSFLVALVKRIVPKGQEG